MTDPLIVDGELLPRYPHFKEEYSRNYVKPVTKAAGDSESRDKTSNSRAQSPEGIYEVGGGMGSDDV